MLNRAFTSQVASLVFWRAKVLLSTAPLIIFFLKETWHTPCPRVQSARLNEIYLLDVSDRSPNRRNNKNVPFPIVKIWYTLYQALWLSPTYRHNRCEIQCIQEKVPKLWTSAAHSFLQQIAQAKNWAHTKDTTLNFKVETQHISLLSWLAKPQAGGILGVLRHCTSEPFDSSWLPYDRLLSWTHVVGPLQPDF